jgi:hypothetical protein
MHTHGVVMPELCRLNNNKYCLIILVYIIIFLTALFSDSVKENFFVTPLILVSTLVSAEDVEVPLKGVGIHSYPLVLFQANKVLFAS